METGDTKGRRGERGLKKRGYRVDLRRKSVNEAFTHLC